MEPREHYIQVKREYLQKKYPSSKDRFEQRWSMLCKFPPQRKAADLEKVIKEYTEMLGHQCSRITTSGVWRDDTKVVTDVVGFQRTIGSKKWTPGGSTKGVADLILTVYGLKLDCEVKFSRGDKMRPTQEKYKLAVTKAGGFYIVVRSFEDFYDQFNEFLRLPQVETMKLFQ